MSGLFPPTNRPTMHDYFATCPRGIEDLLARELETLGARDVKPARAGCAFRGDLAAGYRACLWSRLASRVLLRVAAFEVDGPDALYEGVRAVAWEDHLAPDRTLAVDCAASGAAITHAGHAALKTKDAVVDRLRDRFGRRPSVDARAPDVRLNVRVRGSTAAVSVDLSGDSLHRRGYRRAGGAAPLKENLAAAILARAGWPDAAADGSPLVDPLCGSGTLPLEAALIAARLAPGLLRRRFGFAGWLGHDPGLWDRLRAEARAEADPDAVPPVLGFDRDPRAVDAARRNARAAGLEGVVAFERRDLSAGGPWVPSGVGPGLVVANPPYGERLGRDEDLAPTYEALGTRLKESFAGWRAAVFTGRPDLGKRMGLRAHRVHALYNGALACKLLHFRVEPRWFVDPARNRPGPPPADAPRSRWAEGFANRLAKNHRRLSRWARRGGITCYRVYDADLPEYAVAVDRYEDWVHVQEYAPPATVDPGRAARRLADVLAVVPEVLGVPADHVFLKVRRRQRDGDRYGPLGDGGAFHEVREGGLRFLVNFTDHLDTGLFLDHRLTRARLRDLAGGRRFLNLFAYTATATVYAAAGGAASTTSVDLSRTYGEWARRNLDLNGISGPAHRLVRADCLEWVGAQPAGAYDLVFLDPPTFSNSKRMDRPFEVQRDHPDLVRAAARLLAPGGVLVFSNNFRRFKMAPEILDAFDVRDVTRATLPEDFARNPRIHNCWEIRPR